MTHFQIKLIAIVTMLVDHVGIIFFPDLFILRFIGRLTFPLFAWFIATGADHTKNTRAYLTNLFLLALISQVPFLLFNWEADPNFFALNALFTLSLGLVAIIAMKKLQNVPLRVVAVFICALIATLAHAEYGAWGVLSVVVFWLTLNNTTMRVAGQLGIFVLCYALPAFFPVVSLEGVTWMFFQVSALLALPIIGLANGKLGKKMKFVFYAFYPVHLALLFLLKILLPI